MLERFEMEGFTLSYSQGGEDLILKHIFGKNKRQGLYVDIGCNCPIQKSNTFKLYLKGWSGICVDGNENLIRQFRKIRKRDICLQAIVSDQEKDLIFYQDDLNHELSSVDPEIGKDLKKGSTGLKEISTRSTTLAKILEKYAGPQKIDLLCVDAENHDLEVLKGNDFKRFRPEIVCVEGYVSIDPPSASELHAFLTAAGYKLLALAPPNVYYQCQSAG